MYFIFLFSMSSTCCTLYMLEQVSSIVRGSGWAQGWRCEATRIEQFPDCLCLFEFISTLPHCAVTRSVPPQVIMDPLKTEIAADYRGRFYLFSHSTDLKFSFTKTEIVQTFALGNVHAYCNNCIIHVLSIPCPTRASFRYLILHLKPAAALCSSLEMLFIDNRESLQNGSDDKRARKYIIMMHHSLRPAHLSHNPTSTN